MDIDGLGEETVDLLFSEGMIRNVAIFTILRLNNCFLNRMGEKSVARILSSIKGSVDVPYHRVIFALGIRHVGETVAKTLAAEFPSLGQLMSADLETLTSVNEIGPKIAASIISYFADPGNIEIIKRLTSAGLKMTGESGKKSSGGSLSGMTIVISGVFSKHSRDEYKEIIERNGGRNSSSISGSTSFILAGDNMGPSKREKAEKLGIKIISEDEFLNMTGEL